MLDQSIFGCAVISGLYLFQEMLILNPSITFSKNLMLLLIDKVTTETYKV